MWNELMVRLFGGSCLALMLLAALSTSARVLADPPDGHYTCIAVYFCVSDNCPWMPPCGSKRCQTYGGGSSCYANCVCAEYTWELKCGCTLAPD